MVERKSDSRPRDFHRESDRRYEEIIDEAPSNWGKWGEEDELGSLNYLGPSAVMRGVRAISSGRTFTLGIPIDHPGGDPSWPTRAGADHHMLREKGHFDANKVSRFAYGEWENSDDLLYLYMHGTTHIDALGHVWYDDQLYNGFDAETTNAGLSRCAIDTVANHGITGRGILLDIARHRGVDYLRRGERVTLDELTECADEQNVTIKKRDILVIRTGAMDLFYEKGPERFHEEYAATHEGEPILDEAGLTYSKALADWFQRMEIPLLAADTVTAEQTISETTDTRLPLHPILLRDLGILISEMNRLGKLGESCAEDGQYDFLYVGSPLHVCQGSGAPVNPIVIK